MGNILCYTGAWVDIILGCSMMNNLEQLYAQIKACTKCELRQNSTAPVPGFGGIGSPYMLIGEAPGREEDLAGVPFVGLSGKRLNQLIELAGININDCYITNVCRCRPPKNRYPKKREVKACIPFLWREIELVKPQTIIVLGALPLSLFHTQGVRAMHGTQFEWEMPNEV